MNKNDFKLTVILLLIVAIIFSVLHISNKKKDQNALVYYQDEHILTIDLTLNGEHEYKVMGHSGEMIIKTNGNKIKVEEENSPLHICSNQGWIENSYEMIVCLPNKVIIKLEDKNEIDTVVK